MLSSNTVASVRRDVLASCKELATRTEIGRKLLLPQYRYNFNPEQLWALCEAAAQVRLLGGAYAEIGVYVGATTAFIQRHLREEGGPLPPYYAIDTFEGFTSEDMTVERQRGRKKDYTETYRDLFFANSRSCFERTMKQNGIRNAVAIQADAATFDYSTLPPLVFALVDVDLLRPVRAALAGCWERLLPGGIMIVDDCDPSVRAFDGALQAFREFCENEGLPVDIRHRKLGYAWKPAATEG